MIRLRPRAAWLTPATILLVLPALVAVALSSLHVVTAQRQRAQVLNGARLVADEWGRDLFDLVHTRMLQTVSPVWRAARQWETRLGAAPGSTGSADHLLAALVDCRGCGGVSPRGILVWEREEGLLLGHPALVATHLDSVVRTLPWDTPIPPNRMATVSGEAEVPFLLLFMPFLGSEADTLWVGLDLDLDRVGDLFARSLVETGRARGFSEEAITSLVGLTVRHSTGKLLYRSGPTDGVVRAGVRVWSTQDPYTASLTGDPGFEATLDVATAGVPLLTGGALPGSPWPLALTLGISVVFVTALALLLLARQQELVAERERFVAGVSHELRTPLAQILLYGETLALDRPAPQTRQQAATIIVRETRRLIHLVENVLSLHRSDQASGPSVPAAHRIAPIVEEVVGECRELAANRGVHVSTEVDPSATVLADPVAMRQVFRNLVDNAIRHGREKGHVVVEAHSDGSETCVVVRDDGPGIPVAERARVWLPFSRLTPEDGKGNGLGLAIVRQLIEGCRGQITLGEAAGGGAEFTVRVPRGPASEGSPVSRQAVGPDGSRG